MHFRFQTNPPNCNLEIGTFVSTPKMWYLRPTYVATWGAAGFFPLNLIISDVLLEEPFILGGWDVISPTANSFQDSISGIVQLEYKFTEYLTDKKPNETKIPSLNSICDECQKWKHVNILYLSMIPRNRTINTLLLLPAVSSQILD